MPPPLKPPVLRPGDAVRILSLASPVEEELLRKGCREIECLGYVPKLDATSALAREGFFAGPAASRVSAFKEALAEHGSRAIFCSRGGYGANYLLDGLSVALASPKILLGHSDITSLQICLVAKIWLGYAARPHGCIEPRPWRRGAERLRSGQPAPCSRPKPEMAGSSI